MRVSKAGGSQTVNLQKDALLAAGIKPEHLYHDLASGRRDDRPGLAACLKALRQGDIHGSSIDTTTASGKLVFGIFAALAEYERGQISERTRAGLVSARARGRKGGRKFKMTAAKLRVAQAGMANRDTKVSKLCEELGIKRQTLYRFVAPNGELRADALRLLGSEPSNVSRALPTKQKEEEARMTALMLTRVDVRQNEARFYKLDIQPTLFDEWSLVREWGRIGRAGTVWVETFASRGRADIALASNWTRKLKRGYR